VVEVERKVLDMTTTRKNGRTVVAVLALVVSTACGGSSGTMGSDPGAPASPGDPGNPGTPVASATLKGSVQGLSSGLVVNGVAFRTSGARIRDDGGATSTLSGENEVRGRVAEGEVVTVRGVLDDGGTSGQATEIEVHHSVEGEVEAKGPGVVVVAGTTVSVDDSTRVADRNGNPLVSDDILVGERVEISGHDDGRGGVRATSVQESAQAAGSERELRAWVVAVSGTLVDLSFSSGGPAAVRVDVGGISPAPAVTAGTFVEVRTVGPADGSGVYTATSIHAEDDLRPQAADRVEVEGIVTALDAGGFTVGSQRVATTATTSFRGGTLDDLVVGVGLEVEGTLRADGVLEAREVKFRPSARVEANASAVDAAAGTFQVLGLVVHVTPSTELRNLASLGSLAAGAYVQVRGYPTLDGAGLNATRVELLGSAPSDRAFLRGVVAAKTPTSSLQILGIAIDTSAASFRDHSNASIGATAFFDAIATGQTIVKVRWRPYPASTSEPVDEAELQN
jgi:hypothetical protein